MSEINLSSAVRSSLLSLQSTADLLATTQERLATGNRVNSALDDPTAFFTAAALNDRAADLNTLLDEQGQAIQVVQAADDGISAIQDLVQTARAIATQALQTDSQSERATLATQYDAILGQIEELAGDASFNGTNLLDSLNSQSLQVIFNEDGSSNLTVQGVNFTDAGDANGLNLQRISSVATGTPGVTPSPIAISSLDSAGTLTIDGDGAGLGASFDIDLSILPTTGGTATTNASLAIDASTLDNTSAIDIVVGGETLTISAGDAADAATLEASINAAVAGNANLSGANLSVSIVGSTVTLTSDISDISTTTTGTGAGTATTAGGANGTEFIAGTPGTITQGSIIAAINSAGASTGVSAIADGTTGFTLSSTSGNVTAFDTGTLNVSGTGFVAGQGNDFATNADINATLAAIDAALGTLRTTASTFGTNLSTIQIRSDFTENLINTLEVGAGNLTLADLNEEGANLLTLQTRQQLASTSLSFATQADQAVLSLFG